MEIITDPAKARRIVQEHFFGKKKTALFNSGRAEDLGGIWMRSQWERNYARFLEWQKRNGLIAGWEYEPKRFFFEGYKRNPHSYLPDFRVWLNRCEWEWHEVKGWKKSLGMTALKRMAKHYPQEKIVVIDTKAYSEIRRQVAGLIPFWEGER